MEKAINAKTKKINVIYGFFNDINYGVDYTSLTEKIELIDLFPYINKGETELKISPYRVNPLIRALCLACPELNENPWGDTYTHTFYVDIRTLSYEPTIAVGFRIVENAA